MFPTVPEPSLWRGALRPSRRLLALRQVLPWKFRQVCSINVLCFGKLGTIGCGFSYPDAASDGPCFSGAGDVSTEAEVGHNMRRRQAVITRCFVPLSGQEPGPVEFGSRKRSRELLQQAFDDGNGKFEMRILQVWFLAGSSFP